LFAIVGGQINDILFYNNSIQFYNKYTVILLGFSFGVGFGAELVTVDYLKEYLSRQELEVPLLLLIGVIHTAGQLPLQVHQRRLRTPTRIKQLTAMGG